MSNLLPKAHELLERIKRDLSALHGSDDRSEIAVKEQRKAIDGFIKRQEAYLMAISSACASGNKPPKEVDSSPLWLPPPGKSVNFGVWGAPEEQFVREMKQAQEAKRPVKPEEVIGLARLACNTAHELQNLAVAPRGGAQSDAHV